MTGMNFLYEQPSPIKYVGCVSFINATFPYCQHRNVAFHDEAVQRNLPTERIEKGMTVYTSNGRTGVEFPVESGFIDILALDKQGKFVVIELKVARGRNKTIGQILYYMGWVDKNLGNGSCRGMIIAKEISPDLILATERVPGVYLHRYKLSVSLEQVTGLV